MTEPTLAAGDDPEGIEKVWEANLERLGPVIDEIETEFFAELRRRRGALDSVTENETSSS